MLGEHKDGGNWSVGARFSAGATRNSSDNVRTSFRKVRPTSNFVRTPPGMAKTRFFSKIGSSATRYSSDKVKTRSNKVKGAVRDV